MQVQYVKPAKPDMNGVETRGPYGGSGGFAQQVNQAYAAYGYPTGVVVSHGDHVYGINLVFGSNATVKFGTTNGSKTGAMKLAAVIK